MKSARDPADRLLFPRLGLQLGWGVKAATANRTVALHDILPYYYV
jgi:hypothetical protein